MLASRRRNSRRRAPRELRCVELNRCAARARIELNHAALLNFAVVLIVAIALRQKNCHNQQTKRRQNHHGVRKRQLNPLFSLSFWIVHRYKHYIIISPLAHSIVLAV